MTALMGAAYIVALGGTAAAVKLEHWGWVKAGVAALIGIGIILGNIISNP